MKKWAFLFITMFSAALPLAAELKVGDKAPGFALTGMDGEKVLLGSMLAGNKPVVISFFATWCKPCLKEIPQLQQVEAATGAKVYLVSIDELPKEQLAQFLKDNAVTLPVLRDPAGAAIGENYDVLQGGLARVPRLFLISPTGMIKYISGGYDENIASILAKEVALINQEMARKPDELAILFTNSANGYLESCDCPANPYGGLVRRATYFKQQRTVHPNVLALESGDFFKPYVSDALADYLLKVYELLGYDAVSPGDQEFSYSRFAGMMGSYKIPFLASNISYCEGDACRALTPSSMIVEKAGLRILLVSAMHPDVFILYPESITKHVTILPLKDTLSAVIERNKGKYDLLVLISHSGDDADKQIAMELPDVDIIVGGHSQALIKQPVQIGKTLIVQAGPDAQNVGKLVLSFNENKKINSYQYDMIPLTKDIPDDPDIRALIDAYKQALKSK